MSNRELHLHPGDEDMLNVLQMTDLNVNKIVMYNLHVSRNLADALLHFFQAKVHFLSQTMSLNETLSLEILSCTGCVDRVVEQYAHHDFLNTADGDNISRAINRELLLEHTHPDYFDNSVFLALGMALDSRLRIADKMGNASSGKLRLRLYQPVLSENKVWALSQGLRDNLNLQELDLSSCRLAPLHVTRVTQIIAEGLKENKALRRLRLGDCKLLDDQIACLVEGLRGHPKLDMLDLAGNYCGSLGMAALASSFSFSRSTTDEASLSDLDLDLSCNSVGMHLAREDIVSSWQGTPAFTGRIVALNFSDTLLDDEDLDSLVNMLFRRNITGTCTWSSSIRRLNLSGNKFSDYGIHALAQAIRNYQCNPENGDRRWKSLIMKRSSSLTEAGLQQLADAMEFNVDLEELQIFEPWQLPATASTASALHQTLFYTMLNKGGRKMLQEKAEELPFSVWPLWLEKVNKNIDWSIYQTNADNGRLNVLYNIINRGPFLREQREEI